MNFDLTRIKTQETPVRAKTKSIEILKVSILPLEGLLSCVNKFCIQSRQAFFVTPLETSINLRGLIVLDKRILPQPAGRRGSDLMAFDLSSHRLRFLAPALLVAVPCLLLPLSQQSRFSSHFPSKALHPPRCHHRLVAKVTLARCYKETLRHLCSTVNLHQLSGREPSA